MANKRLDLDCGIAFARIEQWLSEELGLPREGTFWVFSECDQMCRIQLNRLEPRTVGLASIERTRLLAEGDATALERFERLFTLRFLSAGG